MSEPGAGLTLGKLSDLAEDCFESIRASNIPYHFGREARDKLLADIEGHQMEWGESAFLFNSLRWRMENEIALVSKWPDDQKTFLPDGREKNEYRLSYSIELLDDFAVNYFLQELSVFFKHTDISAISRTCSAQIRAFANDIDMRHLRRAFEVCKEETDRRIEEARLERENRLALGFYDESPPQNTLESEEAADDIPFDSHLTGQQRAIAVKAFLAEYGLLASANKKSWSNLLTVLNGGRDADNLARHMSKPLSRITKPQHKRLLDLAKLFKAIGENAVAMRIVSEANKAFQGNNPKTTQS